MGTSRLAFVFGAGLIGVFFLAISIDPLVTGRVEFGATTISITSVESEGFPDADYLEVTGGFIVFSEAHSRLSGENNEDVTLRRLSAPVVSGSLLEQWQASIDLGEPIDASRLRLIISFEGEKIEELWPHVKRLAEEEKPLDQPPIEMTVIGETIPGQFMIANPMQSGVPKTGLDWTLTREMRFERHFDNPFRVFRRLAFGLLLLALAVAMFRYHRKQPDDVTTNVLDVTPLFDDD